MSSICRVSLLLALMVGFGAGARGQDFDYIIEDEVLEYDPQTGVGSVEVSFYIEEQATSPGFPNNVPGWSRSVAHDPSLLSVSAVEQGEYILTIDPDFFGWMIQADGWYLNTVYSFIGASICTYEVQKETVVVTYDTVSAAFAGDSVGVSAALIHMSLGEPPAPNVVVVSGQSLPVNAIDAILEIRPPLPPAFIRSDANGDGVLTPVADGIATLAWVINGLPIPCHAAADANDDGALDVADPIYVLTWGFIGGVEPPAPFPLCGVDPTEDLLSCDGPVCP